MGPYSFPYSHALVHIFSHAFPIEIGGKSIKIMHICVQCKMPILMGFHLFQWKAHSVNQYSKKETSELNVNQSQRRPLP